MAFKQKRACFQPHEILHSSWFNHRRGFPFNCNISFDFSKFNAIFVTSLHGKTKYEQDIVFYSDLHGLPYDMLLQQQEQQAICHRRITMLGRHLA